VGYAQDGELVAEFLISGEEKLFESFTLAFAGRAFLGEGDVGGFVIFVTCREFD
jgi:hypothetical protein